MKRSKLERFVEILKLLAINGPLIPEQIMGKSNINSIVLKEDLCFLVKQGLVKEQAISKGRIVFEVSQQGINVLTYFREIKQMLTIVGAVQS